MEHHQEEQHTHYESPKRKKTRGGGAWERL